MAPDESGANPVGADERMVDGRTWAYGCEDIHRLGGGQGR